MTIRIHPGNPKIFAFRGHPAVLVGTALPLLPGPRRRRRPEPAPDAPGWDTCRNSCTPEPGRRPRTYSLAMPVAGGGEREFMLPTFTNDLPVKIRRA